VVLAAVKFPNTDNGTEGLLVARDRVLSTIPLASGHSPGAGVGPLQYADCPQVLASQFKASERWVINPYSHDTVVPLAAVGRMLYSGGQEAPLELIDAESGRVVTDLVPRVSTSSPIAVSPDHRYLAVSAQRSFKPFALNTVSVFDIRTGTLLRLIRTKNAIANERRAVVFGPGAKTLGIRFRDGKAAIYRLSLERGQPLIDSVRALDASPLSDEDKREIYEFRRRFPRTVGWG
jgi:hypothetical protein